MLVEFFCQGRWNERNGSFSVFAVNENEHKDPREVIFQKTHLSPSAMLYWPSSPPFSSNFIIPMSHEFFCSLSSIGLFMFM